jgi:hypothetical protein
VSESASFLEGSRELAVLVAWGRRKGNVKAHTLCKRHKESTRGDEGSAFGFVRFSLTSVFRSAPRFRRSFRPHNIIPRPPVYRRLDRVAVSCFQRLSVISNPCTVD